MEIPRSVRTLMTAVARSKWDSMKDIFLLDAFLMCKLKYTFIQLLYKYLKKGERLKNVENLDFLKVI